jgi:hypothetical protein
VSDVFVSYRRADRARVAPLVEGLRRAGLSVWWDRDISGGEAWRQSISEHLEAARCVVVVWSEGSVGALGEFVHDEAGRAKARGVLVPVRIDRVDEPIGFGEVQSVDLVAWRGNRRNARFLELVGLVKAVVAGGPRPQPRAAGRLRRLVAAWGSGLGVAATVFGFATNVVGMQQVLCKAPGLHAWCAARGWGGLPTREEEAVWTARVAGGDCADLRSYLVRFPTGAYAETAARRLQAAVTLDEERWVQEVHRLPLTLRTTLAPLASEQAARADALTRGAIDASTACEGFKAGSFRLVAATAEARSWRCFGRGSGTVCGFDGDAICQVEARVVAERQVCR